MKNFVILFFLVAGFFHTIYAQQEKYRRHTIEKGENISQIARKYKVTPYDIYRLNPDAQNGIKENTVLLIPMQSLPEQKAMPAKESPTKIANPIHEVQPKETLYSLSKKYNVSIEDLKKINGEALNNGLQTGQQIIIPIKGNVVAEQVKQIKKDEKKEITSYLFHTVEEGETAYSIAKKYGMTLQLLEELNPEVKEVLPLGYKLKLDKRSIIAKETSVPKTTDEEEFITYIVKPKETFYSLTRTFNITEDRLIALNPEAKNGLKEGMELKLPKTVSLSDSDSSSSSYKPVSSSALVNSLNKTQTKELVLMLPFNLARVESDTVRSTQQRLQSDKFLNMTLDFYAGALMAIDSARTLGLPLKVKIFDSKETKNTADIEVLRNSLSVTDAIIGPFFQNNVEKAAAMAGGIPVVSPLSKERGKPYPNLFQTIPSSAKVKAVMIDYLKSKNGNVIAVVDAKKSSSRQYLSNNYPEIRFAALDEKGMVTATGLKNILVSGRMNYVILETESLNMVLNTTKILLDALPEFQVQLVVLEKTDLLEYDEIPLNRLTRLKMLYPSVTKDNETPEAAIFSKVFKEKNGIFPNQFATRGFDVTFDVILRLFQQQDFNEVAGIASEQVENKFYYQKEEGGNYNNGVYIMYYDEDLTVKQAQ